MIISVSIDSTIKFTCYPIHATVRSSINHFQRKLNQNNPEFTLREPK